MYGLGFHEGAALFWSLHLAWILLALATLRRPRAGDASHTVLIAARNEAPRIQETLDRLQDERVIVAEGPSTDATRDIVASSHAQLVPLAAVPPGWVGKSAALHAAAPEATGDWIVFLDADVHVEPGGVAQAIGAAQASDLSIVLPGQATDTIGGASAHFAVGQGLLIPTPPWVLRAGWGATGVGHFMVARRSIYDASGGHASFRNAILDDVALGRAMRKAGGRLDMVDGGRLATSDWGRSYVGVARAMQKNAFAGLSYRWWMVALMSGGYAATLTAAWTGWWFGGTAAWATWAWAAHAIPSLWQVAMRRGWHPRAGWRSWLGALLSPFGWTLYAWVPVWSMMSTWRRITWRGTQYDRKSMR
ncbi:MAG: glycosyltransferase [Thermoplasmatota archaeon]